VSDDKLPRIRIETGATAIFTRVFVDDRELRGVTRVWFDTGDIDAGDRPRKAWRDTTRVHIEFIPGDLIVEGIADTDFIEQRPKAVPA
jgi:hypothetical protein